MLSARPLHPVELISARIDGQITRGEERFLEAHLRMCAACQKKEAELRTIVSGLAGLPIGVPTPQAIGLLLSRLRERDRPTPAAAPVIAAAADADTEEKPSPGPRRLTQGLSLAGAAVLLTTVVSVFRLGVPGAGGASLPVAVPLPDPVAVHAPVPDPLPVPVPVPLPGVPSLADAPASPAECAADAPSAECAADASTSNVAFREAPRSPAPSAAGLTSTSRTPRPVPASAPETAMVAEPVASVVTPVQEPAQDASSRPVSVEVREGLPLEARRVLRPIAFKDSGKRLTGEARERVQSVADFLRQHGDARLVIHGYGNEKRSAEGNIELAQRRADAVARELESLGIDPSRLRPVSHNDRRLSDGRRGNAEDENGRVEFALEH